MKALIFDVESTGLFDNASMPSEKLPEIIEWYSILVDLDTGETFSEFETFVRPQRAISDEITRITGITSEMVSDAPRFSDVFPRIKQEIESAPRVIAHNASYDHELTCIEARRLHQEIKWPRVLCTVEATIHLNSYRLNLQGLHEHLFGERFPAAHRARNDVAALTRCCIELRKRGEI